MTCSLYLLARVRTCSRRRLTGAHGTAARSAGVVPFLLLDGRHVDGAYTVAVEEIEVVVDRQRTQNHSTGFSWESRRSKV